MWPVTRRRGDISVFNAFRPLQACRLILYLVAMLLPLAVSACSTGIRLDATVSPYVGKPASLLVTRLGPPTTQYVNAQGQIVFQWRDIGAKKVASLEGMMVHTYDCVLTVESAPLFGQPSSDMEDWTIAAYKLSGEGCV